MEFLTAGLLPERVVLLFNPFRRSLPLIVTFRPFTPKVVTDLLGLKPAV